MDKKDNSLIYYHYHELNEYDSMFEQDEVDFTNKTNQIGELVRIMSHLSDIELLNLIKSGNYDKSLKTDLEMVYRERLLESFRPLYQDIPSRQRCIYLCDEKGLNFWGKVLSNDGRKLQLYKVELSRKPFFSSVHLLPRIDDLNNNYEEKAKAYWHPASILKEYADTEYLYTGKVKILERIK